LWDPGKAFRQAPRILKPSGQFGIRPLSAGGYLWFVSDTGELFRFSPFWDDGLVPVMALGEGSGSNFPVALGNWGQSARRRLCAALSDSILTVDLAMPRPQWGPRVSLPGGMRCAAFQRTVFPELALWNDAIYFLGERVAANQQEPLFLGRWPIGSADVQEVGKLPRDASGPFLAGDRVLVTTPEALVEWDGQQFSRTPFPTGFRPWVTQIAGGRLRPAHAHPMHVVARDGLYLPGGRDGQDFGFLFRGHHGREFHWVHPQGRAVYYCNRAGMTALATVGRLWQLRSGLLSPLESDAEIPSEGIPLAENGWAVARVQRVAGPALCFFFPGGPQDFPFNSLGDHAGLDFFLDVVWGALSYVYGRLDRQVGIVAWRLFAN
jgi:hypothetical protein